MPCASNRRFAGSVPVPKADAQPGVALQVELEIGVGAEDEGLNEGHRPFFLAGFLPLKQGAELLGFQVGREQRVIDRRELAVHLPGPRSRVSEQPAAAALDLDEEQALRREYQKIDLVDAAIVGDELEVRPGAVGLMGGEMQTHKVQGIPFPGILALSECVPVASGGHCHSGPRVFAC